MHNIPNFDDTNIVNAIKQTNNSKSFGPDNLTIPLEKHPKILGITFDTHFNFSKHINEITNKANKTI